MSLGPGYTQKEGVCTMYCPTMSDTKVFIVFQRATHKGGLKNLGCTAMLYKCGGKCSFSLLKDINSVKV